MLTAVDADTEAVRIYALSMVFANAAARAEVKQASSEASADARGESFIKACLGQLGALGWRFTSAGSTTLTQSTTSFGLGPGRRAASATTLAKAIAAGAGSAVQEVLDQVEASAGADDSVLTFWWKNVAAEERSLLCGIGKVSGGTDAPSLALDFMQVDLTNLKLPSPGLLGKAKPFRPTSVGDLFVDVDAETVNVVSRRSYTATLDVAVFNAKRSAVESRLGAKFADHYATSPGIKF
jgi:hypothetical protein